MAVALLPIIKPVRTLMLELNKQKGFLVYEE